MKERPIIFSGPMVRAILADKKTQTRRVTKPQPIWVPHDGILAFDDAANRRIRCPYGQVGDRLWVKETAMGPIQIAEKHNAPVANGFHYQADLTNEQIRWLTNIGFRWRPPMFMSRDESRINLLIIGIWVEQLQNLLWLDAAAEGMTYLFEIGYDETFNGERIIQGHDWPEQNYARYWDSIHGAGSWASNPWVWVIEFERLLGG